MALTATATPSVRQEVIDHLDSPVTSIGTMNQINTFYQVQMLLSSQGKFDHGGFRGGERLHSVLNGKSTTSKNNDYGSPPYVYTLISAKM